MTQLISSSPGTEHIAPESAQLAPIPYQEARPIPGQALPYSANDMALVQAIVQGIAPKQAGLSDKQRALPRGVETPEQAFMLLVWGLDHGIPPTTALQQVYWIYGGPFPSAQLMMGMVRSKEPEARFVFHERSLERADVELIRASGERIRVEYTIDMAFVTGQVKKNPSEQDLLGSWYRYRRDMLTWNAVRRVCKLGAPELINALGVNLGPEPELAAEDEAAATHFVEAGDQPEPIDREELIQAYQEALRKYGATTEQVLPALSAYDGKGSADRLVAWRRANPDVTVDDFVRLAVAGEDQGSELPSDDEAIEGEVVRREGA